MRRPALVLLLAAPLWLGGCDLLGLESASDIAARKEAEGKAIGGACRHAARSIEECYEQNKRADKAAVFAGWREMNDYMRENNLEAQPAAPRGPQVAAATEDEAKAGGAAEGASDGAGEGRAEARGTTGGRGPTKAEAKADAQGDAKAGTPADGRAGRSPARTTGN